MSCLEQDTITNGTIAVNSMCFIHLLLLLMVLKKSVN